MTLRYLEIFLALARTPNMRDAAAKLFISQAAVSSALRDFEAELGVSLFDRMGRGIRLTAFAGPRCRPCAGRWTGLTACTTGRYG